MGGETRNEPEGACVLAVDLGGTNMSVAMVGRGEGGMEIRRSARYATAKEPSPLAPLRDFLSRPGAMAPLAVCVAGAGVATKERIDSRNLPWPVERGALAEGLGLPVVLINDFQAVMRGILSRSPADAAYFEPLKAPRGVPGSGPICAIGPGTGLGFGYAVPAGDGYEVYPSEGGGTLLPVWDRDSEALREFLSAKLGGEPCAEDAVSGPGIGRIFEFEASRSPALAGPGTLAGRILSLPESERPRAVSEAACTDPACARAMERFALTLASVAAGAALAFMPFGGLFIAGGVCAKNLGILRDPGFARRFLSHRGGAYVRLLERVPLYAVTEYSISILGAASAAFEALDAGEGKRPPSASIGERPS